MAKKKQIKIKFPLGGINRNFAYHQAPPYTTYDALNVMPKGPAEHRRRGGSRSGLTLAYSDNLGGNTLLLTSMTVAPGIVANVDSLTLESLSPADNATDVDIATNLILTFSTAVRAGTGNIIIYKAADDSVFETIDITGSRVTFAGDTVTVDPTNNFASDTAYYVQLDSGAIQDVLGNTYSISDKTTWNFTTILVINYDTLTELSEEYDGDDELTAGPVLATSTGIIYGPPKGKSYAQYHKVFRLDPNTDAITHIGAGYPTFANYGWHGAALADTGLIYCAPYNDTKILKIDPSDDTIAELSDTYSGSNKWAYAVYANGAVYCIPGSYDSILKINTSNESTSLIPTGASGSLKWSGGALANNNCIYCAPRGQENILKIDTSNDSISTIGSGLASCTGPVLAGNGYIYCAPATANRVMKINPAADTYSFVGSDYGSDSTKFEGPGALGTDGCIYWFPCNVDYVLKLDPSDDTTSTIGEITPPGASGDGLFCGCARADNGVIYALPYNSTRAMKLS